MSEYLEEELGGALQHPVEAMGEGSTDGSTRMLVTEQLETLTLATLRKHLGELRDHKARPLQPARRGWVRRLAVAELTCGETVSSVNTCLEGAGQ